MTAVLTIEHLTKSYARRQALQGLSLNVGAGQVFGLLGPNGSGKTTTLGIVLGSVHADSGRYSWFDSGTSGQVRRRIGALLEQPCFYPWLSAQANLKVLASIKKLPSTAVDEPLKTVGLWEVRQQLFQTYSLGMKQRLAIAGALLGQPEVLVLDEPTNGVDAQGIFDIRSLISGYAARGGTVILASHMLDEVEKVCSHLAILQHGKVLRSGPLDSVLATKGWIEVGASDLKALAAALKEIEPTARREAAGELIEVYDPTLSAAELNSRLSARGLYVGHLCARQPSLESQYLQLIAADRQEPS